MGMNIKWQFCVYKRVCWDIYICSVCVCVYVVFQIYIVNPSIGLVKCGLSGKMWAQIIQFYIIHFFKSVQIAHCAYMNVLHSQISFGSGPKAKSFLKCIWLNLKPFLWTSMQIRLLSNEVAALTASCGSSVLVPWKKGCFWPQHLQWKCVEQGYQGCCCCGSWTGEA